MAGTSSAPVLIVNDRKADLVALAEILHPLGEPILAAQSAREALALATANELAVAIVDICMPGMDGFALVESFRRDPQRAQLPVLFATAFEITPELAKRVYELGAADLLPLPSAPEMLRSKVAVFIQLHRETARERGYVREVRAAAATEVHAQQERFRLLVDAISDYALFFMDALGLISEWTVSAERLLGYRASEVHGEHFRFIFTPEDRAAGRAEAELQTATRHGQSHDDRVHIRRDGAHIPVNGRTIALKDRDGTLRGFAKIMRDATETAALRESEAKYRQIFETANEGIWILNAESVIETANQRIAEMLGYEVGELVGRSKRDFVFPDDQAYVDGLFEERRSGKIQPALEVRFRRKDGTAIWTLLSARPIFRDGKFAGALDMFTDVTRRRLAEDHFRIFFESSAAGYALVDPASHRFLSVNRCFCEIVGRDEAELRQLTFDDITHPQDRAHDQQRFGALFDGTVREVSAEKRYVRPDGSTVWVQLTTTVTRDPAGKPELQLSVVHDISSRKETEAQLAENRTRLRLAVEAADLGIFYHDGVTGVDSWNDQIKQLIGLRPDEPESVELFLNRIHPDDRPAVDRKIAGILRTTDEPVEWELVYRVIRPDGSVRWVKTNGVSEPRQTANGEKTFHSVGTTRDITAEKEFEAELQRQIATRTGELNAKTKQMEGFTYTVAHDLRAPLRAINGFADIVLDEVRGAASADSIAYLERIKAATQRLDALIQDLLGYSRITQVSLVLAPVDLGRIAAHVVEDLQPEIERRGATVILDVPASLPLALGEQSTLEQVVHNLVTNALKFAKPGDPPRVDISAANGNGRVKLSVRDRGIGIPAAYQERIFRVFERLQTSREYPGTGVGLAIVAQGLERIGGRYGVESVPGEGSTFWIELQQAEAGHAKTG